MKLRIDRYKAKRCCVKGCDNLFVYQENRKYCTEHDYKSEYGRERAKGYLRQYTLARNKKLINK